MSVHKVPILLITGRFFLLDWGFFPNKTQYLYKNDNGTVNNPAQFVNISSILFFLHTFFVPFIGSLFKYSSSTERYGDQQIFVAGLIRARIRPVITLKLYARILQRTFA